MKSKLNDITSVLACRFRPANWMLQSSSLVQPRGIDAAAIMPRSCEGCLIKTNQGYENGPPLQLRLGSHPSKGAIDPDRFCRSAPR